LFVCREVTGAELHRFFEVYAELFKDGKTGFPKVNTTDSTVIVWKQKLS